MDKILEIVLEEGNIDFSVFSGTLSKLNQKQFVNLMKTLDVAKTRLSQAYEINKKK